MIHVPDPELQINFAAALADIRNCYLQDVLGKTVRSLLVPDIDKELAAYVPPHSLTALAAHGLRGEMIFPVPLVLKANPSFSAITVYSTATVRKSFTLQKRVSAASKVWKSAVSYHPPSFLIFQGCVLPCAVQEHYCLLASELPRLMPGSLMI